MIAVASLLALTAGPASAGLLTPTEAGSLTSFTYSGYSVVNEVNVTISGSPGQNGYFGSGQIDLFGTAANAGEILAAWCIDVFHDLQGGDIYDIVSAPFTNNGGVGPSTINSTQLGEIGALVHYGDANINTAGVSAAVQLAIWKVEYPGGTFTSDSSSVNTLVTNLLLNDTSPAFTSIKEVVDQNPIINQGLVFEVAGGSNGGLGPDPTPLPSTWTMMLTGLGAMGLLGWRRKRKSSAALAAA
jgi:hypothetical protein